MLLCTPNLCKVLDFERIVFNDVEANVNLEQQQKQLEDVLPPSASNGFVR